MFNKNVTSDQKEGIYQALGEVKEVSQAKYLDLLLVFTRSKNQMFSYSTGRIKGKLSNWKKKFLIKVGKKSF